MFLLVKFLLYSLAAVYGVCDRKDVKLNRG